MTLKKFDLQLALSGKPVSTRIGNPITRLTHFPESINPNSRLAGLMNGTITSWSVNGSYWASENESQYDLFMLVEEREFAVAVWNSVGGLCATIESSSFALQPGFVSATDSGATKELLAVTTVFVPVDRLQPRWR